MKDQRQTDRVTTPTRCNSSPRPSAGASRGDRAAGGRPPCKKLASRSPMSFVCIPCWNGRIRREKPWRELIFPGGFDKPDLNFQKVYTKAKAPHQNCLKLYFSTLQETCQIQQEAQLLPSDRAMRLVSSNLANCHATVQKLLIGPTTSPDQTDGMKLEV